MNRIVVLGNNGRLASEFICTEFIRNVTHFNDIAEVLNFCSDNIPPNSHIINCISDTNTSYEANLDNMMFLNYDIPKALSDFCETNNCTLIQPSTDAVFYERVDGGNLTPYAMSKIKMEKSLNGRKHVLVLRFTNIFNKNSTNIVSRLIDKKNKNEEILIDRNVILYLTHTKCIHDWILDNIKTTGVYNIVTDYVCSLQEFCIDILDYDNFSFIGQSIYSEESFLGINNDKHNRHIIDNSRKYLEDFIV